MRAAGSGSRRGREGGIRLRAWLVCLAALALAACEAPPGGLEPTVSPEEAPLRRALLPASGRPAHLRDLVFLPEPTEASPGADGPPVARLLTGAAPHVHYLNFSDGTTVLTKGQVDDASKNVSAICGTAPLPFRKWEGTEEEKLEFARKLQKLWAPYNIVVTLERPTNGDYSMEMIGPAGNGCEFDANVAGVAILDCNDAQKRNVTFTFAGGYVTTAQETAHALGLEHTPLPCDVMGAGYATEACRGERWSYPDEEAPILEPRCGRKTQNSHRRMTAMLGPWPDDEPRPDAWAATCAEDDGAPQVEVVAPTPSDGADVETSFSLAAEAADGCPGVVRARVSVPSRGLAHDVLGAGPFAWDLALDPGVVDIVVEAWDAHGNRGEARARVRIGGQGDLARPEPEAPAAEAAQAEPRSLVARGAGPGGCAVGGPAWPAGPASRASGGWAVALLIAAALRSGRVRRAHRCC